MAGANNERIRQLQRNISSWNQSLRQIINRLGELRGKKGSLETRLRQLRDIRRNASNHSLNQYSDEVYNDEGKLMNDLNKAVKSHAHSSELESYVGGDRERSFSEDARGSEALRYIDQEIVRVERELEETNRQIQSNENNQKVLNRNIKNANSSIRNLQMQG